MQCIYCRQEIPQERADFLAETGRPLVCVGCTGEQPVMALVEYGHKTAGYLVIVGSNPETQRRALRQFKRAR